MFRTGFIESVTPHLFRVMRRLIAPLLEQRIIHESKTWEPLRHENIVPFLGYCGPKDKVPFMVSEWMDNGGVRQYLDRRALLTPPKDDICPVIVRC